MNFNASYRKVIILSTLAAALVLLAASQYVETKQKNYRLALNEKFTQVESHMTRITELIMADSADTTVNELVKDCELDSRQRFDELLSNLSDLKGSELNEVSNLFDLCASYYSDRQALLVTRFGRELEYLNDLVYLLSLTDASVANEQKQVEIWDRLGDLLTKRQQYTAALVEIQGKIIDQLQQGNSLSSDAIKDLSQEAQSVKDQLLVNVEETTKLLLEVKDI